MSVSGFYQAVVQKHGNIADAARALGVARTTLRDRIERERRLHGVVDVASETHQLSLPVLPESRPSIDEILERMTGDFETKRAATDAAEWFPVAVRDNKPFGLWVWGDPHLDNPGCDISLLRHHIELARHPAVFSLNIGDTLDGWVGRLVRLYGESSIDVHNARELALWFMREVRWLLWLAGNHDMWADNEAILRIMSKQPGVKLLPWQAKFTLDFPSGASFKVHAAHDFPGRSMANIVHGHMRAARFTSPADLFLAGHLHDWGSSQFEMAGFNRTPVSLRVRGYKTIDSYAVVNGYQSSRFGGSCLVIIDPNIEGPGSIQPYWNVEQGIDVLDILAKRYQGEPRAPAAKPPASKPPARRARKAVGRKPTVRASLEKKPKRRTKA